MALHSRSGPIEAPSGQVSVQLLLAPFSQLSSDGQLRFGGRLEQICLSSIWLHEKALELPAPAPQAKVV